MILLRSGRSFRSSRQAGAHDPGECGVQRQYGQDPGTAGDHQSAQPGPLIHFPYLSWNNGNSSLPVPELEQRQLLSSRLIVDYRVKSMAPSHLRPGNLRGAN